jgi:hypothetical protein
VPHPWPEFFGIQPFGSSPSPEPTGPEADQAIQEVSVAPDILPGTHTLSRMDPGSIPSTVPWGWVPVAGSNYSRFVPVSPSRKDSSFPWQLEENHFRPMGSQERVQTDEGSREFEASQQVSARDSFQDGRRACGERSPAKWRLYVQDLPKGCAFRDTCLQRAPASFAFHFGLRDVSVYMSSVWPCISASSFTKVLRPVVGFLRLGGVKCVNYLDDLLIMAGSRDLTAMQCAASTQLLESLGSLVNYSNLTHSQHRN